MSRILIVEDDWPIAEAIADELSDAGHVVDVVSNGAEALESLRAIRPDVVVLDLLLPVLSGWTFVERYREFTRGEVLPVIVVSGAGAVTRSMEGLGVRKFLAKPIDGAELRRAVEDVT